MTDTDIKAAVPRLLVDHLSFATCKVHQVRRCGLVLVDEFLGIGEPLNVGLEGAAIFGELLLLTLAISRHGPQFVLTGGVIKVSNPLAIRAPCWRALSNAIGAGQIARNAIFRRSGPDIATSGNCYALGTGANAGALQFVADIFSARANGGAVAGNLHFHGASLAGSKIQDHQLCALLEDNFAVADRRPLDVFIRE